MSSTQPSPPGPTPPLLRLVEKPDRGRCLIAAGPIKPGQIVLIDSPLVLYPSTLNYIHFFCSRCFRVLPSMVFPCPSCHVALFCSARCLSLSHPSLLCHALPSLLSGAVTWPDDLLFLLSAYSLPSSSLLQLLTLHSYSHFPDESIQILHSELSSLIPSNLVPNHFSPDTTSSLISKEKTNSFALMNPMDPKYEACGVAGARAYGLYPWASLFNHDCLPNVCRFDYIDDPNRENNTDFIFRALHEIKEGSEICISYVSVTRGYRKRQKKLMEDYGFECKCDRCKDESQWKENLGEEEEEQEEEEEDKDNTGEKEMEVGKEEGEREMSEEGGNGEEVDDDFSPYSEFLTKYMCDCGGNLAPLPPLNDGVVSDLMECNGCGTVKKDESGSAGDAHI